MSDELPINTPRPALTLVLPTYNEQAVFATLRQRLTAFLATLDMTVEVIFVDDGSHDDTPSLIRQWSREDPRIKGVILSRNFGHQVAVTAGLAHARGEAVAVLDADLQDPPELVLDFYQKLREGFDVVYGVRQNRRENILKRAAYKIFYRVLRWLSPLPIPLDSGDFCLMRRRVVQVINEMPERHRFVRGMRTWAGFKQIAFPYDRPARAAGETHYSFSRLLGLALDGICTFSERPLRWSAVAGLLLALGSMAYGLYILIWRLISTERVEGFATLAVGMFFLSGVQLLSIGILGEYLGRVHNEVKRRPLYVIDERVGFGQPAAEPTPANTINA